MTITICTTVDEALDALASSPAPQVLAGGTDLMVDINFGRRRPECVVSVNRIPELCEWRMLGAPEELPAAGASAIEILTAGTPADGFVVPGTAAEELPGSGTAVDDHLGAGSVYLGAGVTYRDMTAMDLALQVPALAQAARSVGSPQIRNAGTLGGNLATASPAGDTLPVLLALDAVVHLASSRGSRSLPVADLLVGAKRSALERDELIVGVSVPSRFGHQEFLKIGTRNAMVIAVASVALVVRWDPLDIRVALGSVGPTVLRATEAEQFALEHLDPSIGGFAGGDADLRAFASLVSAGARPIDDHRSSAAYRRHAVGVCAARALERAMVARQETVAAQGPSGARLSSSGSSGATPSVGGVRGASADGAASDQANLSSDRSPGEPPCATA